MSLFTTLRRQQHHLSSTDEKDHDSDSDDQQNRSSTPLLSGSSSLFPPNNSSNTHEEKFSLRIKLNDGTQPNNSSDFSLDEIRPGMTTVRELKEAILKKHSSPSSSNTTPDDTKNNNGGNNNNRYLRLIVRGRMMAPDTSTLDKFSITKNDVIHAILAKEGTRGGSRRGCCDD